MKEILLSAVVIVTSPISTFGETPCFEPVLFIENGYGVVHTHCHRLTYYEAMQRWQESERQKFFEPLTWLEDYRFIPNVEMELSFHKPEPSSKSYEDRLKEDVDYQTAYEDRYKVRKPRPPGSYDPERWDYVRIVDNNHRDGWGFLIWGGQRSTGLNLRERAVASRIQGSDFRNSHYELLAGRFSYRWGSKRNIR